MRFPKIHPDSAIAKIAYLIIGLLIFWGALSAGWLDSCAQSGLMGACPPGTKSASGYSGSRYIHMCIER